MLIRPLPATAARLMVLVVENRLVIVHFEFIFKDIVALGARRHLQKLDTCMKNIEIVYMNYHDKQKTNCQIL